MKTDLLDPIDAQHSGELIGAVLGSSFLGFAISLLVISPLLDRIGAKRVILFAASCFIIGPGLVLLASATGGSVVTLLNIAMVIWGCGWGATEASINPIITALYPDAKTGKLNSLHAWWPFGIIVGGLLSVLFFRTFEMDWKVLVGLTILPGIALAIWASRQSFPKPKAPF